MYVYNCDYNGQSLTVRHPDGRRHSGRQSRDQMVQIGNELFSFRLENPARENNSNRKLLVFSLVEYYVYRRGKMKKRSHFILRDQGNKKPTSVFPFLKLILSFEQLRSSRYVGTAGAISPKCIAIMITRYLPTCLPSRQVPTYYYFKQEIILIEETTFVAYKFASRCPIINNFII